MRVPHAVLLLVALAPGFAGCLDGVAGPGPERLAEGILDLPPEPPWPPIDSALIRPGVPLRTQAGDCPTNFVFTRPDNGAVFLGTTAHCVRDLPIGALATIGTDAHLAVLVYSSFVTMDEIGEQDPLAREYNDFAVFYVDSSARPDVHPALLDVGGPTAAADPSALRAGDRVLAYTSGGELAAAPPALAPRAPRLPGEAGWQEATVTGHAGGWAVLVHGAPPVLPGGMGGAVVTPEGAAVGIVVNLGVNPGTGGNGVARLDALMSYAAEHANLDMVLATWPRLA